MAKLDKYHYEARRALEKDGWTITHDPFILKIGTKVLSADLGAERVLLAEKEHRKIIVEVKSFIGQSEVKDLQQAVGQYMMYLRIMARHHIDDRTLYVAITEQAYRNVFEIEVGQLFLQDQFLRLIVFDPVEEVITQWIPD